MCGICGFFDKNARQSLLREMNGALKHRGPDEEGYYTGEGFGLAMSRLKVIDLVTGSQPICNEDGSVLTVFNGEIYNFSELRGMLIQKGHRFRTASDTEVIVHLYEDLGPDFVSRLNGMFSIALLDTRKNLLMLARDQVGIKPLYYYAEGGNIYFASELKALQKLPFSFEIDPEALPLYFYYTFIPAPRTIFRNVKKLMPGSYLLFKNGAAAEKKYWDLEFTGELRDEKKIMEELPGVFTGAVKRQLISDVPLGVFLSGGIDSSSIVSAMSECGVRDIKTFSIGFREESFNELSHAALVARHFNTTHLTETLDPDIVMSLIPEIINYLDEPMADASVIPTFLVSKLARRKVTVALSGDGGDELFGGYNTYQAHKAARLLKAVLPPAVLETLRKLTGLLPGDTKNLSFELKVKKLFDAINDKPEYFNFLWWGAYSKRRLPLILNPEIAGPGLEDAVNAPVKSALKNFRGPAYLDKFFFLDILLYLQDELLVKVDRMSMAHSLEVRVPFLDMEVINYARRIDAGLKVKGMGLKHILRKSMADRLPGGIARREKKGFDIPVGAWLKTGLKDFMMDTLSEAAVKKMGFFNYSGIRAVIDDHLEGRHNNRQYLWTLMVFANWYRRYYEKSA